MIIKNGVEEYSPRQGTGSYPLPPQGWQLAILFAASHDPFSGPYFRIASIAYWLQVGGYNRDMDYASFKIRYYSSGRQFLLPTSLIITSFYVQLLSTAGFYRADK